MARRPGAGGVEGPTLLLFIVADGRGEVVMRFTISLPFENPAAWFPSSDFSPSCPLVLVMLRLSGRRPAAFLASRAAANEEAVLLSPLLCLEGMGEVGGCCCHGRGEVLDPPEPSLKPEDAEPNGGELA